jgi:hypothetical protein
MFVTVLLPPPAHVGAEASAGAGGGTAPFDEQELNARSRSREPIDVATIEYPDGACSPPG